MEFIYGSETLLKKAGSFAAYLTMSMRPDFVTYF